jgi:hypothetical protein
MNTKATLLAVTAFGLAATSTFAQGIIGFVNTSTTLVSTNSGTGTGSATSASGTKIQLFYQPATSGTAPTAISDILGSTLGSWEAVGTAGTVGSPLAGRFGSFTDTTGSDVAPQGNVWLIAVAWNGGAATYSAAGQAIGTTTTYVGYSTVWSQATGGNGNGPVSTTGFTGLVLTPVPEPTTIALAGLGAASLLLFRRRK